MSELRLAIGARVSDEDGACGELRRLVVDPDRHAITHLVVAPHDAPALGRLVPIGLAEPAGDEVRLRCDRSRFQALEHAEEVEVLPMPEPTLAYTGADTLYWPYYAPVSPLTVTEHVPLGDIEVRHGDPVNAADGTIGRVQGLVVDPEHHDRITHVILQEGHFWGRRRVSIPATAIKDIDAEGLHVSLTRHEIGQLPEIDVAPAGARG